MAENDFLTSPSVMPRVGNASASGIDFRDFDYVRDNSKFLQMPDWNEASNAFSSTQPEPAKVESFEHERQMLTDELCPLRVEQENLEQNIIQRRQQQQQEFEQLEAIAVFKSSLLKLLPEKYREDGRVFLNNFIMQRNDGNFFPGEGPKYDGLKSKAENLLFLHWLNKFKSEFLKLSQDFKSFAPRFDIGAAKDEAKAEIFSYYNVEELERQSEYLLEKINKIKIKQDELAAAAGSERMSLAHKLERLKSYYDKQLYKEINFEDVPFMPEKEHFFEKFENLSLTWRGLLREARNKNIHFGETTGLLDNGFPVAAAYDPRENRILCNPSFSADEQVFETAKILLDKVQHLLSGDYDARSRYLYELCRQAEKSAKMVALAADFSMFLPTFKSRVVSLYADIMSVFISGNSPMDKYAKAFVKALSTNTVRSEARFAVLHQILNNQKIIVSNKEDFVLKSLSIGEIISPFVSRGAPLLNENAEMKKQLEKIPSDDKIKIQEAANVDKDYSLLDFAIY